MRLRIDTLFGHGHGYAELVPGLQEVVRAAGRVLRAPDGRGWLWQLDERYRCSKVRALRPAWWQIDDGAARLSGLPPAGARPPARTSGSGR